MPNTKVKTDKTTKPVAYRARHKRLKHLKAEDTTHGFMERIQQPLLQYQTVTMLTGQPAFCGVLGDNISDSVQMTISNYRSVPDRLQNRVRHCADTTSDTTASSNRLSSPPADLHSKPKQRQSFYHCIDDNPSSLLCPQLCENGKTIDCKEEEDPQEHILTQTDLSPGHLNTVDRGLNSGPCYEPIYHRFYEDPFHIRAVEPKTFSEESVYQAPMGLCCDPNIFYTTFYIGGIDFAAKPLGAKCRKFSTRIVVP